MAPPRVPSKSDEPTWLVAEVETVATEASSSCKAQELAGIEPVEVVEPLTVVEVGP